MAAARRLRPLAWTLAGVVIALVIGLWLTLGVRPASVETAPAVATPPATEPAPMPQPQPASRGARP